MGTSLILSTPGRPALIKQGSCTIYLSVHDQFFRRRLKELKDLVRDCHPDHRWWTKRSIEGSFRSTGRFTINRGPHQLKVVRKNSSTSFLIAKQMLEDFLKEEITYYHQFDLRPPFN